MALITLENSIAKTEQVVTSSEVLAPSIDFNEFYINPNQKVIRFDVEYYDAEGVFMQVERKEITGDDFDTWLASEFATLLAVRNSLVNYLKTTGEIVGEATDTTGA